MRKQTSGGSSRMIFLLLGLIVVALGVASLLQTPEADKTTPDASVSSALFIPRPVKMDTRLYLLGALSPSVAYVIETDEGLILVDAGLEDSHESLLQQVQFLGLEIANLKYILLTHGHGDHYLGAAALKRLTGAEICAGKGDCEVLRQAGPREAVFSTFPMAHVPIHPTTVDREFVGGEVLELGDARITVIATPGHTPGSMCYLLERKDRTALFSGDTVMTITGDLGTYAAYLPPRYRGNAFDYLNTLKELSQLPAPDLLLPGHPRMDMQMVNARITPEDWSARLSDGIRSMTVLTQRLDTDGADFLDGQPKQLQKGLFYLSDFEGTATYCLQSSEELIVFDPVGGPQFAEFLGRQLAEFDLQPSDVTAIVLTGVDDERTEGAKTLSGISDCTVVVADDMRGELNTRMPAAKVRSLSELNDSLGRAAFNSVALEGVSNTQAVYHFVLEGKTILISGSAPLKFDEQSIRELQLNSTARVDWLKTLERLRKLRPDVWLPGRPVHGQMANLYDTEWQSIIRENQFSLRF